MLPISLLASGSQAKIVRVQGNDALRNKLAGMGFVEDCLVTIIGNSGGGCLILKVAESRVALDSALCCRIMVEELVADNMVRKEGGNQNGKSKRRRMWQHS